jgi:hypothetical protein
LPDTRRVARRAVGAQGPKGDSGVTGAQGAKGDPGIGIGDSCPGGSAIRAVADDGAVTCQTDTDTTYTATAPLTLSGTQFALPQATDTTAGYLSAADHVRVTSPYSYSWSVSSGSLGVNQSGSGVTSWYSVPANAVVNAAVVHVSAEWTGGSAANPITLTCTLTLDGTPYATRRSTNVGGYSDLSLDARAPVGTGDHPVQVNCSTNGLAATMTKTDVTAVSTE